jgi:hypothetical protein
MQYFLPFTESLSINEDWIMHFIKVVQTEEAIEGWELTFGM